MNVSIVIPVYNEADRLEACLRSIAAQTIRPYEVIVVDNNSTDNTAAVAQGFSFVRLIYEPRQGVVHARTSGFNAARGEIIARTDGDAILPNDWVEKIESAFHNPGLSAISGPLGYYDFAWPEVAAIADRLARSYLNLNSKKILGGANMAIRRSSWLGIRSRLCAESEIHEDFDLAIHLQKNGYAVEYAACLEASVSARRINMGFLEFVRYTLASPRTFSRHRLNARRYWYPTLLLCWASWLPGRAIYRSGNAESALMPRRADPTTNVV